MDRLERGEQILVEEAIKEMEAAGYTCTFEENGKFKAFVAGGGGDTEVHEDIDFVRCELETQDGLFVRSYTEYALVVENGLVVDQLIYFFSHGF